MLIIKNWYFTRRLTDGYMNEILRISTLIVKHTIDQLVDAIQIKISHLLLLCIIIFIIKNVLIDK